MKKIALGHVLVAVACLCLVLGIGIGVGISVKAADASRNSSGTYTLATSAVTSGQVIGSGLWNNTFNDLASSMTDSLDRNGRGGMLASLRSVDGTLAAPSFSFTSETGTGDYRAGAGDLRRAVSGTDVVKYATTGVTIPGTSQTLTLSGASSKVGIGAAATYPLDVQTQVGATNARFVASTNPPVFVYTQASNSDIGFNLRHDGTNIKYDTTNTGALWQFETTGPALVAYTAPSGTAGNTATVTERLRVNANGSLISTGIGADGSGFKHQTSGAGCSTAASVGAACGTTLTWTTQFADSNYQAVCSCYTTGGGVPVIGSWTKSAQAVTVQTVAVTAVAAQCGNITCIAVHD